MNTHKTLLTHSIVHDPAWDWRTRQQHSWLRHSLFVGMLIIMNVWFQIGALYAQSSIIRLSTPIPTFAGDVEEFVSTSDGRSVVYLANHTQAGVVELYSAPIKGGEPIKLNLPLSMDTDVVSFQISADSRSVVYKTKTDAESNLTSQQQGKASVAPESTAGRDALPAPLLGGVDLTWYQMEWDRGRLAENEYSAGGAALYSVPITGGESERLVMMGAEDIVISDYGLSPDSRYVIYRADFTGEDQYQLYTIPLLGGAPTRLNGQLTPDGDVHWFQISPDGARVVYYADQDMNPRGELYSVSITGGEPVLLSDLLGSTDSFFAISPNGQQVYYIQNDKMLVSTSITDGARTLLNEGPLPVGSLHSFQVSADGSHLVYRADAEQQGKHELYSLSVAGGLPVKLNVALDSLGDVGGGDSWLYPENYAISPDSRHVVYLVDVEGDFLFDLYSSPIAGGTAAKLNLPLPELSIVGGNFRITTDGAQVIFGVYGYYTTPYTLYRAPIEGGETILLSDKLLGNFQLSGNEQQVIYQGIESAPGSLDLYMRPLSGGASVRLNSPLVEGGTVLSDFALSPDGSHVLYRADQEFADVIELYNRPLTANTTPLKLSNANQTATAHDVNAFKLSADNRYVVYRTDWEQDQRLYSVALGGGGALRLDNQSREAGKVERFDVSPDSTQVVFTAKGSLYSVPIIGGAPVRLDLLSSESADINFFRISPNSQRVVFCVGRSALFSVLIAGGALIQLNGPLPPGGDIGDPSDPFPDFQISPDSQHVVYRADQDTFNVLELYSVSIAGGSPVKLNPLLPARAEVGGRENNQYDFLIAPDSSRVIYLIDESIQDEGYGYDLYQTLLLGGPALKLNQGDFNVTHFQISPDSKEIIYRADYGHALYRVSIHGGASLRLSAPLPRNGSLERDYIITNDGHTVLYRANQERADTLELYSTPMDGGYPTRLNASFVPQRVVQSFAASASGQIVVYLADQAEHELFSLYRISVAGGPTTQLNTPLSRYEQIEQYQINLNDQFVVYQVEREQTGQPESHALYVAPVQGGKVVTLTTAHRADQECRPDCFQITSNSELIVFLGRHPNALFVELYAALPPNTKYTYLPLIQR